MQVLSQQSSPHLEKVCVERRAHHGAGWRLTWANHINYRASDRVPPAVVAALQRTLVEVSGMFLKAASAALTRAEATPP